MRRLFAESLEPAEVLLDRDAIAHAKVLRLKDGEEIELFDGRGGRAVALLEGKRARILSRSEAPSEAGLVLVMGLPKGSKCDVVVRAATELGATAIRFVTTERAVPQLDAKRAAKRAERWRRVAREAARQSERDFVPGIEAVTPLGDAIAAAPEDAGRYVCWARGGERFARRGDESWIAVGPEGGFTDAELGLFDDAGWSRLRLARHVLRAETAALAALALAGR